MLSTSPHARSYDIAIIGAGVLGVSLAYHLRNSKLKIAVFDKEQAVAQHASGRNAGMIRQLYKNPYLTSWAKRSISLYPDTVKEKCFKQTGSLILGRTVPEHHRDLFEQKLISFKKGKYPAVYTKTDGLLDSGAYVEGLKFMSKDLVDFYLNTKIKKCIREGSAWLLLDESDREIKSQIVVNASGAWFNSALPENHPKFKVQAYRRHLMLGKGFENCKIFDQDSALNRDLPEFGYFWDEIHEWYMRDWGRKEGTGERLLSACEKVSSEPESEEIPASLEFELSEKLRKTYPDIYNKIKIGRSWYCFRTYNKQELPIWGKDPYNESLYHLGAFGGFGMSTSLAATFDLAELILGKEDHCYQDFDPCKSLNG